MYARLLFVVVGIFWSVFQPVLVGIRETSITLRENCGLAAPEAADIRLPS
jgi:hypothetical protein